MTIQRLNRNPRRWLALAAGLWLAAAPAAAETQYVQVAKARLLKKPSAFSAALGTLAYRSKVEVLGTTGAFCRVRTALGPGYLPQRSLHPQRPRISAGLSREYVSSDEVAMATKGFSEQVESQYRQQNPSLPYAELDRFEAVTTYPDPAARFAPFRRQGRLGEYQAGGAQ